MSIIAKKIASDGQVTDIPLSDSPNDAEIIVQLEGADNIVWLYRNQGYDVVVGTTRGQPAPERSRLVLGVPPRSAEGLTDEEARAIATLERTEREFDRHLSELAEAAQRNLDRSQT